VPNLRRIGSAAEDAAAEFLQAQGFTIVTRRFKARRGELDIVALEGDQLVFVEVKQRSARGYRPEDSMGDGKRRALYLAGQEYLACIGETERHVRFDLVAIDAAGIRHHRDVLSE
jgi:putative endonuclease